MKYFISTLFLTITVVIASAQTKLDSSKHLSFKGVPIDGTLADYVSKMKNSGFIHKETKNGVAILEGDFASYKSCFVGVSTLKKKDLVCKIVVLFPDRDTWSTLSSNYFNLKEMLTEKYGSPSEVVEKFESYSQPNNDGDKMYEVKFDKCKYNTTYETEKGTIHLSIEHDGVIKCFVRLLYIDKINGEVIRKQALDDL